jgi:hypothetical protein
MLAAESRAELQSVLDAASRPVTLHDGDCFAVLARRDAVPAPVGVYFYDGAHTGLAHYLALGGGRAAARRRGGGAGRRRELADGRRRDPPLHPTGTRAGPCCGTVRAAADHDERWANGLLVLRYRRPPGAARMMAGDVRWRRSGPGARPRAGDPRWSGGRCTGSPGWCRWRSGVVPKSSGPSRADPVG